MAVFPAVYARKPVTLLITIEVKRGEMNDDVLSVSTTKRSRRAESLTTVHPSNEKSMDATKKRNRGKQFPKKSFHF
jgi:hypothetical protein